MKLRLPYLSAITLGLGLAGLAHSQNAIAFPPDWALECWDVPNQKTPFSNPYLANSVTNELMHCTLGAGGTFIFGGDKGPCFDKGTGGAETIQNAGKFAFSYGHYAGNGGNSRFPAAVGSLQRYSEHFSSAGMALNFGAPDTPADCYANLVIDGTKTYWGAHYNEFFAGFSNRYIFFTERDGPFDTRLQVELVADAIRLRWRLTNNTNTSHTCGLWFGSGVSMLTDETLKIGKVDPSVDHFNAGYAPSGDLHPDMAGGFHNFDLFTNSRRVPKASQPNDPGVVDKIFVYLPNQRPPDTDISFDKTLNPVTFPDYVDFLFGQTDAFGLRFENKPSEATNDIPANQPTKATGFDMGKDLFVLGDLKNAANTFPDTLIPDTGFLEEPAFVQKFPAQQVLAGSTLQILHYIRTNWGQANYALPFGAVVDAPHVIQVRSTDFDQNPAQGNLAPNPMKIRVWIDNVGGFGFDQREFPLNDVRVTLSFAQPGLSFVNTASTQTISSIDARTMKFVDFVVSAGPDVTGQVDYTVLITAQPGALSKTIKGNIIFGARPRLKLYPGPNMVAAPFNFIDSSWNAIFKNFQDPNVPNGSVQTYAWDPKQQGYVISLNNERGRGAWAIFNDSPKTPVTQDFAAQPSVPPGFNESTQLVQLNPGWNMIANPYNYPFPIQQINGVSSGDPQNAHTFQELVSLGFVANYVATWDPVTQSYVYANGNDGVLEPNKAYWIDVITDNDLTLSYPPLFIEAIPDSIRKANHVQSKTAAQWQMQMVVRSQRGADINNRLGVVNTAAETKTANVMKAPMAPRQPVQLAIGGTDPRGRPAFFTKVYATPSARYEFPIYVDVNETGPVQISWPDVVSVPNKYSVTFVDGAAKIRSDMRKWSTYSFTAFAPGRREFKVVIEPVPTPAPIIGAATIAYMRVGYAPAYAINYGLANVATTSVTILNGSGQVIAVVHNSRADQAGENREVWNARNLSGQWVTAGNYTLKISASSGNSTDTKLVPFTIR